MGNGLHMIKYIALIQRQLQVQTTKWY